MVQIYLLFTAYAALFAIHVIPAWGGAKRKENRPSFQGYYRRSQRAGNSGHFFKPYCDACNG